MLDASIFANLLFLPGVALYTAFDVRSVLEGGAKLLLLFCAMRAPVGTVHDDMTVSQAFGKGVITMRLIAGDSGYGGEGQQNHETGNDPISGEPR